MFSKRSRRGFTLTELTVSMAIGSIVAALILTYLHVTAVLVAKNLGTNFSHNSLHKSLDWMTDRIQTAEYIPVLLTSGSTVALTSGSGSAYLTSGSASISSQSTQVMGIYFDRLVGNPYVFPSTSGTISASATSLTVQYSGNVYANPPAPQANDVILVNGATATTGSGTSSVTTTLRPMVSSATVTTSGSYQSAAITLSGSFGGTYSWDNTSSGTSNPEYQTAIIIHREAFLVISNTTTGNNELRYYPNFENVTTLASPQYASSSSTVSYVVLTSANLTALNNTANYVLLTDQIGTIPLASTPYLPFSEMTTGAGATLVGVDIRIRGSQYNNVLDTSVSNSSAVQTKEAYEFSQFARVITITPMREHPVAVFQ
jgi:prepilin-type N-terminal cleavage/methylation domain-containing protein